MFDAFLDLPEHPTEAERQLHYIAWQVGAGYREPADEALLVERGRDILRAAARSTVPAAA